MDVRINFVSRQRLVGALVFALLISGLAACSDGSDFSGDKGPIELQGLLPVSSRGVLQVTGGDPELAPGQAQLSPVGLLRKYSGGMPLAQNAQRLMLVQVAERLDEYILLADLGDADSGAVLAQADLQRAGSYRGYKLQAIAGTNLLLARLNRQTWVVAARAGVEHVIDVHRGDKASIQDGPLAPHLDVFDSAQPYSLVYGLPALYGPVMAPGDGDASLSQAQVVRSAFGLDGDELAGELQFTSDNAEVYTARLLEVLVESRAPAITATGNVIDIDLSGLSASDDVLPLLKTLFLDMDALDYSEAVIHGGNSPWMNFNVGENPNSIFINFEFSGPEQREVFEAQHLPAGFHLAPLRILASDQPRYFLVLNIYQSSGGLVSGARAEWSVFVQDPDTGEPRFLVVQAAAASIAADSVNKLTLPEPVNHELEVDAIVSYVGAPNPDTGEEETYFSSRIPWPHMPQRREAFAREFVVANDYIFWGNAVADRTLYNSSVHNRDAVVVAAKDLDFMDNSRWASFVNPLPVHALVYLNALDIVISPWWNLDADYLDVTEDYRQELIGFKNSFYPGTVQAQAKAALRGEGLALTSVTTGDSQPTVHYHFPIIDPAGLQASIDEGRGWVLAPLALHEGDAPGYYLSLYVYARENDPCGTRAEWVTYAEDAQGRPWTLRLDAFSSEVCLDPVSLLGVPGNVEQSSAGDSVTTHLASPFVRFDAQLDLAQSSDAVAASNWIEAGDRVCSTNDVCDHFFYDGQILLQAARRVAFAGIVINEIATPWDDFISSEPEQVTVRRKPAITALNPWRNQRSFSAPADE